jgi:ribosomal protein S6--L-glutamate ligase
MGWHRPPRNGDFGGGGRCPPGWRCRPVKSRTVVLGKRLRGSGELKPLGVRPNIEDYTEAELETLRAADTVYYPSGLFEPVFLALGKRVFPANYYPFLGDKIKQAALFTFLDIPFPRTRIYYGRDKARRILQDFRLPFIAKIPRGSSQGRGVFLIRTPADLNRYLEQVSPAYIQEYLPIDRDLRVVVLDGKMLHAYWRIARPGEFRTNVSLGARISLDGVPPEALRFAEWVAARCGFGEAGLDICHGGEGYLVLEANMMYGLQGFVAAGLDIYSLISERLSQGSPR